MTSNALRRVLSASVVAIAIAIAGCRDSNVEKTDVKQSDVATQSPKEGVSSQAASPHGTTSAPVSSAAGITWTVPASWKAGGERQMRVASYVIGESGKEADCAVFYFGPGQGGAVDANVERWISQFGQPGGADSRKAAKIDHHTIAGLKVTTIDLSGIYLASMGGGMSPKSEPQPGFRLLGAIVEAPEGPVFFKITGPEQTMIQALDDFQQFVESVKKL
jgi:hypothetical protein